jgi:hypothetical protein
LQILFKESNLKIETVIAKGNWKIKINRKVRKVCSKEWAGDKNVKSAKKILFMNSFALFVSLPGTAQAVPGSAPFGVN